MPHCDDLRRPATTCDDLRRVRLTTWRGVCVPTGTHVGRLTNLRPFVVGDAFLTR